jgi:hypothetical protein
MNYTMKLSLIVVALLSCIRVGFLHEPNKRLIKLVVVLSDDVINLWRQSTNLTRFLRDLR